MRRSALLLVAGLAAGGFAPSAEASIYCRDLGPVPGWGPVCLVHCATTVDPEVDVKDWRATLQSLVVYCPA